ncbi:DNA-binding protein [Propionigenium maris DSM 9537]|uniref:DNA-binding protein n=1 Tax=Propionigenium maris DSM 9537 TaxID=1123000 RepID=A0A9W6GIV8_9FUSO|nr:XRE family transcriptional regulator [Propionigenium maris]GLI54907.1 DNA-binding protein [Propionigenium maris DSM 9537]
MTANIGEKIKELRVGKGMTLKDLGEKVELSTGFLSQLERGLTTISVDVLQRISLELGVELTYFFREIKKEKKIVMRGYEKEVYEVVNSQFIHYHLSNDLTDKTMVPRIIDILPREKQERIKGYSHEGEEFVYVLEGILTLVMDDREEILYPGDSAHYSSASLHNWGNDTSKKTRIIAVGTPNSYKE